MAPSYFADFLAAHPSSRDDSALPRGLSEHARESVFAPYRQRILYPLAASATITLLPLAAHHLLLGRYELGGMLLLLVCMLGADAVAIARRMRPPVPFALLLLPGAASILISLPEHSIFGAMWSYPMVMFSYFVLPRRLANAASVSFLGMAASLMALQDDPGTTLRFGLSLGFCILIVNVILNVLDSLHARLLALSIVDPLTGAFNRRHMAHAAAQALERHRRSGAPASMLLIDVDRFKSVNDLFGHGAGDQVLRDVVAAARERARRLDTLFRIGGEEFVLLLPDASAAEALVLANDLRRHIARRCSAGGQAVTVSIGVAELEGADSQDEWLRRADRALYRAKSEGRNRAIAA